MIASLGLSAIREPGELVVSGNTTRTTTHATSPRGPLLNGRRATHWFQTKGLGTFPHRRS
jgi:hypothetical protein